jgi:UDP-apiose/xylose synthase
MKVDIPSRIAIFGGGGFIGSHLVKSLADRQYGDIICLDITEEKLQEIAPSKGYKFRYCDVRTDDELAGKVIQESDMVIDLIAYANPITYLERPLEVVELNLFDNLKIADHCARLEKTLIQFSTCEVYGKTGGSTEPFSEDTTDFLLGPVANHRWIYSCAKQLLERIIHAKGLRHELEYVIIRPFNFIGPEMDYLIQSRADGTPRVFPNFMSSLLYNQPMYLVNGGVSQRSFIYIDDAIDAILLILENPDRVKNEIVDIGNPHNEISVRGLAYLMTDLYEQIASDVPNAPIVEVPAQDFYGEGYEDCDRRIPDMTKLAELGWQPQHNLEQTLRKSMQYYCDARASLVRTKPG